jgi:hypothetical protein
LQLTGLQMLTFSEHMLDEVRHYDFLVTDAFLDL